MSFDKNAYYREYFKRHRIRIQEALDLRGRVCIKCGTTERLQFHHRPGEEKLFNIASSDGRSDVVFWNEVEKCDVLCIKCHAVVTHTKYVFEHGTMNTYERYKCRCELCVKAYAKGRRIQAKNGPTNIRREFLLYLETLKKELGI